MQSIRRIFDFLNYFCRKNDSLLSIIRGFLHHMYIPCHWLHNILLSNGVDSLRQFATQIQCLLLLYTNVVGANHMMSLLQHYLVCGHWPVT